MDFKQFLKEFDLDEAQKRMHGGRIQSRQARLALQRNRRTPDLVPGGPAPPPLPGRQDEPPKALPQRQEPREVDAKVVPTKQIPGSTGTVVPPKQIPGSTVPSRGEDRKPKQDPNIITRIRRKGDQWGSNIQGWKDKFKRYANAVRVPYTDPDGTKKYRWQTKPQPGKSGQDLLGSVGGSPQGTSAARPETWKDHAKVLGATALKNVANVAGHTAQEVEDRTLPTSLRVGLKRAQLLKPSIRGSGEPEVSDEEKKKKKRKAPGISDDDPTEGTMHVYDRMGSLLADETDTPLVKERVRKKKIQRSITVEARRSPERTVGMQIPPGRRSPKDVQVEIDRKQAALKAQKKPISGPDASKESSAEANIADADRPGRSAKG